MLETERKHLLQPRVGLQPYFCEFLPPHHAISSQCGNRTLAQALHAAGTLRPARLSGQGHSRGRFLHAESDEKKSPVGVTHRVAHRGTPRCLQKRARKPLKRKGAEPFTATKERAGR